MRLRHRTGIPAKLPQATQMLQCAQPRDSGAPELVRSAMTTRASEELWRWAAAEVDSVFVGARRRGGEQLAGRCRTEFVAMNRTERGVLDSGGDTLCQVTSNHNLPQYNAVFRLRCCVHGSVAKGISVFER